MDIADALALLSKDCSDMQEVRCHAVAILEKATSEDLQLYLLHLVQALRYEPIGQDDGKVPSAVTEFNPPLLPGPYRQPKFLQLLSHHLDLITICVH